MSSRDKQLKDLYAKLSFAYSVPFYALEDAADIGAADEREACAALAERIEDRWHGSGSGWDIVHAIRARGAR